MRDSPKHKVTYTSNEANYVQDIDAEAEALNPISETVPETNITTDQPTQSDASPADADVDQDQKPSGPQLRPEAVHLHGVDDMSTQDIKTYFSEYNPIKIEWVNDTSCKAKFHPLNKFRKKHTKHADINIFFVRQCCI